MPNWLHRTSKQVLHSVASADLPEVQADYIEEPDLSAVEGRPVKYWVVSGDTVLLLNQSSRDAVDAAEDSGQLDSIADELEQARTVMRAFAEVMLSEINLLRAEHGLTPRTLRQLRNAVRSKL